MKTIKLLVLVFFTFMLLSGSIFSYADNAPTFAALVLHNPKQSFIKAADEFANNIASAGYITHEIGTIAIQKNCGRNFSMYSAISKYISGQPYDLSFPCGSKQAFNTPVPATTGDGPSLKSGRRPLRAIFRSVNRNSTVVRELC